MSGSLAHDAAREPQPTSPATSAESDAPAAVSVREAAAMLGIPAPAVRRAIRRGELAASRRGRAYAIAADEIERFRRRRTREPADAVRRPLLKLVPAGPGAIADGSSWVDESDAGDGDGGGDGGAAGERWDRRGRTSALPAPLTPLVGREREVGAVAALLEREGVRLVTLTGPGGVGKTRLGLEVAREREPAYADGAAFVPLAPVGGADLVAATIAQALAVRDGDELSPPDRLLAHLRERELLLVLDNFEHLADAGPLLVDLLVGCPRLTLLVTSRSPLNLSGEHRYAVPPLALPPPAPAPHAAGDGAAPLATIAASAAVRLFVDRARAVAASFALTPANAPTVAKICEQTDGLPLAIELAAARIAVLSPAALLARLERRLALLADGPRDQPDRLRSVRDAISWSHDLLDPAAQALFRRLAVFVGGCTLEAAEAVAGDSVLDLVASLVDQALLQQVDGVDGPRFGMLETIRAYGLERLAASGEEGAVRGAHAAWCVAFAERAEPELTGPDQTAWVKRIDAELGNVRAAHHWLEARGETEAALRLAGAIGWFWSSAPYLEEGRRRFDAVLALPGSERFSAALAKVLCSAGDVGDWQGDQPRARRHYERALAIYREIGDLGRAAGMLRGLGSLAIDAGEPPRAQALLEESLALATEVGNAWEAAAASNLLGTVAAMRGDLSTARTRHEAAAAGWRALGDVGHVVTGLWSAGWAALIGREVDRAVADFREAFDLAVAGDDAWYTAVGLIGAGGVAAARGDAANGAALRAAGRVRRERLGVPLRPHVQAQLDAIEAAARADLGEGAYAAAVATGEAMADEAAVAAAIAVFEAPVLATAGVLAPQPPHGLTARERDVLRLVAAGRSDKEIAAALFVTRRSASKYVSAVLAKLGVSSRAAASALAHRDRLV